MRDRSCLQRLLHKGCVGGNAALCVACHERFRNQGDNASHNIMLYPKLSIISMTLAIAYYCFIPISSCNDLLLIKLPTR